MVLAESQLVARDRRQRGARLVLHPLFDLAHDLARLLRLAMGHQPARALWDPSAEQQHDKTDRAADEEGEAPAPFGVDQLRVERGAGPDRAERRAQPEAAIDAE